MGPIGPKPAGRPAGRPAAAGWPAGGGGHKAAGGRPAAKWQIGEWTVLEIRPGKLDAVVKFTNK